MQKPSLPKGTRDFGPIQMARRNYILETIKDTFKLFGYNQIETPAMENLSTLTGKYGDEGDQLLFKVLDSGEYFSKLKDSIINSFEKIDSRVIRFLIEFYTEIALEYIENKGKYNSVKSLISGIKKIELWAETKRDILYIQEDIFKRIVEIQNSYRYDIAIGLQFEIREVRKEEPENRDLTYLNSRILKFVNEIVKKFFSDEFLKNELFKQSSREITSKISEKGLRYDLTVPFARFVVMNRNELTFPFKRFQIQPVWRADRPQKGRYREFYQCDADVVGTDSLVCEAEIILMIRRVFAKLNLTDYSIKLNNRKILTGIAESIGEAGNEGPLCVAIDKLDKIGWEKVQEELIGRGFGPSSLEKLSPLVNLQADQDEKLAFLKNFLATSETGLQGVKELEDAFAILESMGEDLSHVDLDIMLARGLSYYTGAIFEVKVNKVSIGSVSGGGRYDNLTGGFGLPGVSGVGFSFGVDRLYDVLEELGLFPVESLKSTEILLTHFDEKGFRYALGILSKLRSAGIQAEIYPDLTKVKKQLEYATKKGIPFVGICGDQEIEDSTIALKNLDSGVQESLSLDVLIGKLK